MAGSNAGAPPRGGRLADFDGYVPDRSNADVDYTVENYAEFLTWPEPRVVRRTGPGRWESTERTRPGELTQHGFRMRLLDRERERREEEAAGIGRNPRRPVKP